MKILITIATTLLLMQCAELQKPSQNPESPRVIDIKPGHGDVLAELQQIYIKLSHPIDPTTVKPTSFLIVAADQAHDYLDSYSGLLKAIRDGDMVSINGDYKFSHHNTEITWQPHQSLVPLQTYHILLTSQISSPEKWPLNQSHDGPSHFVSQFTLNGEIKINSNQTDDNLPEDKPTLTRRPTTLMINEVLYDTSLSDADGHVFIELYGTPKADISGYVIRLINGANGQKTDEIAFKADTFLNDQGLFVIADAKTGASDQTHVQNADHIENFDPQNGPDSIQLLSPTGELIDVVGYGDGLVLQDSEGNALVETNPALDVDEDVSLSRQNQVDSNDNFRDFVSNTAPSPGSFDVSVFIEEIEGSPELEEPQNPPVELTQVHFSEVVTDPQQDWNDSSNGNGIAFDTIVGDGTIGSSDEWIEIKNGLDHSISLTGWSIHMLDGTDAIEELNEDKETYFFSMNGNLSQLSPNEFFVIGNPKGDMKNQITLQLYDDSQQLVDELIVDDANASGIADESYQLDGQQFWSMGQASFGF